MQLSAKLPWFFTTVLAAAILSPAGLAGPLPKDGDPLPVKVTHIRFDHPGSGALPLRMNYIEPVFKPEWMDQGRIGPALFIRGTPVTILARFEAHDAVERAYIGTSGDGPLGSVNPQWVNFTNGISDPEYIPFPTVLPAPDQMGIYNWKWQWKAAIEWKGGGIKAWDLNVSGTHRLYTVLDTPGIPWNTSGYSTQNPWAEVLDLVIPMVRADTAEEVLDQVTELVFDWPCFKYDIVNGAPCYVSGGNKWKFNLTLFIDDMVKGKPPRVGCCYDGGVIVLTLADLLGAKTRYVLSGKPYTSHYFGFLNCIDSIGRGKNYGNNPFYHNYMYRKDPVCYQDGRDWDCKRSLFGNHAFVATEPGSAGILWDATMCADADRNPDTTVVYPPDGTYQSTTLTDTVLTDQNAQWVRDQWAGLLLNPNTRTTTPNPYAEYLIVSNTATEITVEPGSQMLQDADPGDHYWIRDPNQPEVNIIYLTGFSWYDYETLAVDDPYAPGGVDPPVERAVEIY